jgi:hypothetical protein
MNFCDVLLLLLITKLHNRLLVHGFTFIGVAFGCLFFLVTSQWNLKILTSWSSNYLCKFVRKIIIFDMVLGSFEDVFTQMQYPIQHYCTWAPHCSLPMTFNLFFIIMFPFGFQYLTITYINFQT